MRGFLTSVPGIVCVLGLVAMVVLPLLPQIETQQDGTQRIMQVVITIAVLGSALYVILSNKYPDDTQKWAFGAVGMIVGFWLPT